MGESKRASYLNQALQFSDELVELVEIYEDLEVEPPVELQQRLGEAIAICAKSVREAKERWLTQDI